MIASSKIILTQGSDDVGVDINGDHPVDVRILVSDSDEFDPRDFTFA